MSLLGSLEIGKKSLNAAQLGQHTTGHNIANVDTEGYSRQSVTQASAKPLSDGRGQGVDVLNIRRMQDGFTKEKVVQEQTMVGSLATREQILTDAEILFTDLDGNRLRGSLDEFWSAWGQVANQPESVALRKALVVKSENLTQRFNVFQNRLNEFRDTINSKIVGEVTEVNQLSREIAETNKQIGQIENRGMQANDARDRRDVLLQKLSEKVDVQYFENERGNMEVQLANGMNLVHDRNAYEVVPKMDASKKGDIFLSLRNPPGIAQDITDVLQEGSLKEMIRQRDTNIKEYRENLDLMARELAFQVNAIHSQGTGINATKTREISAYALNQEARTQPLPFLKDGHFGFQVRDESGATTSVIDVQVEAGMDTVETIVEKINVAANNYEVVNAETGETKMKENTEFKAVLNEDGSVSLESGMGKTFMYNGDDTNTFAVLGLNTFFQTLDGASDIRVNQELAADEMKIATGYDNVPSDNRIALGIAELQRKNALNDGTTTFDEFYNSQITDIGIKVQDAQRTHSNHTEMLGQFEAIRDSVSAVNVDEEMANMVKYQRAYESSAKFLSTVDEMTQTVINM